MENLIRADAVFVFGHEDPVGAMALLERAGRTCHASEDKISEGSADRFVRMIVKLGHESVLEHCNVTVKVTCDRATSHQWVRHRLGSYTQMSQRYVDHSNDGRHPCRFIDPEFRSTSPGATNRHYTAAMIESPGVPEDVMVMYRTYYASCLQALDSYEKLRAAGAPPEDARAVLPNGTATEFYVTYNLRQWRHFFQERCNPGAQHLIRRLAVSLFWRFCEIFPACFDDLKEKISAWNPASV